MNYIMKLQKYFIQIIIPMKQYGPNKYLNYSSIPYKLFDIFGLYIQNKVFKSSYIKNNNFFFRNNSESSLLFIDLSIIKTNKIIFQIKLLFFIKIMIMQKKKIKKIVLVFINI